MLSNSTPAAGRPNINHVIGKIVAPAEARSFWLRYGLAVVLPCLGFLVTWKLFDLHRAPYFSLFLASVVISSLIGGRGPGLVDTAICTVLGFLLTPPAWTLRVAEPEDAVRIGTFAVLGALISTILGVVGELQRELYRERSTLALSLRSMQEAEKTRIRLATIVESTGDAIISKDLNGIVTSWNPAAEKILGYTAQEMIGRSIITVIPPDLHHDEQEILSTIARGERIEHFDTTRVTKSGERIFVSLTVSPLRDESGRIIGASKILRDITRQKKAERALHQSERLASVGRLAATVAHEINNPLEAVTNLIYLAKDNVTQEKAREYLRLADEELTRVAYITRQTLGFYRETKGATNVRLGTLLETAISIASRTRNKGINILLEIKQDPEIHAVPGEMRQLMVNLLSNSIDAVDVSGRIRVRVSAAKKWGGAKKDGVRLVVADSGSGIPAELRPNLFEPFFTTKSDVGTGLGLWICKNIVEKHDGSIRMKSSTAQGRSWTVFSVFFPSRSEKEAEDEQSRRQFA